MPRYIDAVALMADLDREVELADDWKTAHEIANVVKYFPTADVRENIHGMWIVDEDGNIECSVCGYHGVGDLYCERCGAKMDERREE